MNTELKYYVISVRRDKKEKDVKLFLVEAGFREMVEEAFEYVKDKIPVLNPENCFIEEIFDTTNQKDYLELYTRFMDHVILNKIRYSDIHTFYIMDTYIKISETNFHTSPLSIVHIQSRHAIISDNEWEAKQNKLNEKIRSMTMVSTINPSVLETNHIWKWDDISKDFWETILRTNDLAVVIYDASINTIISLAKLLYPLIVKYQKYLYFFFVDKESGIYKITFDDKMTIEPVENNRYIV